MPNPYSFDDVVQKQLDPYFLAEQRVAALFHELKAAFGEERTRHIFEVFGKPSARRLQELRKKLVLDRLDLMGPEGGGPNVKRLAWMIAHEKYKKPTQQQIETEERYIQRANADREKMRRKEAKRLGPIEG